MCVSVCVCVCMRERERESHHISMDNSRGKFDMEHSEILDQTAVVLSRKKKHKFSQYTTH